MSSDCVTCSDSSPGLKPGDHVHRSNLFDGTRVGGAEYHTVTYVSDEWVGYTIHSSKGEYLGERMEARVHFDSKWEKCS